MSLSGRVAGAVVMTIGLVVLAAAAPAAATVSSISDVKVTADHVQMLFTARSLPGDATIDPAHVTLTVGGTPVPAIATALGGLRRAATRTTVLLVDTSGSMTGNGITGARTAAEAFLSDVAPDVRVGLVAFSDATHVLAKPTTDRASVRNDLGRLTAAGDTRLYDALLVADQQLGATGERHVLLLSDGADTTSHATATQVSNQLRHDGVQVDAVSFRTQPGSNGGLQHVVSATSGTVFQASDTSQVAAAFATVAKAYDQKLSVAFTVPQALRGRSVTVALSVASSAGLLRATTVLDVPAPPITTTSSTPSPSSAPATVVTPTVATTTTSAGSPSPTSSSTPLAVAPVRPSGTLSGNGLLLAAGVFGLGLFLLLLLALDVGREAVGRRRTLKRVGRFSLRGAAVAEESDTHGLRETAVARTALELAGRIVERRDPEQKLRMLLDRAAIPLRPSEWLLVLAGAAFGGMTLLTLLTSNLLVGLLIGGPLGGVLPHLVAKLKARRRVNAFLAALPDALQLTAGSLATGYSLPQALDTIVRQGSDPIAGEIGRALAQARLGIPLEDALQELAERMQSKDFEWVVMAIRINREVGGNLSEVLTTVARTLREREQLRRHVRALSAEGRLSAYILVALPVGISLFLFTFRRAYIRPLYTQPLGIVMLSVAGFLVVTGALWMRSLVKVEV
jgi:tight adherence protein B